MLIANTTALTLLLVLAIAVLARKGKQLQDIVLLLIILFFAAFLVSDIWINYSLNRWSYAYQNLTGYYTFLPFFFYAMLLISRDHRVRKSWWGYTAFHGVYSVFIILDVFVLNDYSQADMKELFLAPPWTYHFFYKGLHVYMIGMMIWLLTKMRRYQRKIKDYYSNVEEVRLDWLKYFIRIYIILYSTSLVTFLSFNLGLIPDIKIPYLVISVLMVASLFWLIFRGMRQHSLANFSEPPGQSASTNPKYMTSSLSDQVANDLYEMILELFEGEKIFHKPELKVQHIAEKLGVTSHNISQVLNQKAGKSFYDFVNDYRIDYFKELLTDPDKRRFTILALGMESGFNSKASLNRVFKQQIGKTPKEYQKQTLVS